MNTPLFRFAAIACCLSSLASAQEITGPVGVANSSAEIEILGQTPFIADQVIIRFDASVDFEAARRLVDNERYEVVEPLIASLNMFLVRINDGTFVANAIVELQELDAVMYAAPDHLVADRDTLPNDPTYGNQWCHTKMQSAKAWDFGTGSSDFVVAVVDGGCLIGHTDLTANIYDNTAEINGTPGVDDDGNGYVDDKHGWNAYNNNGNIPNNGHGTHVNGIVGARGNNGTGVAGVNWQVTLMPIAGSSGSTSTVTKAYGYALQQKTVWINTNGAKGANVVSTNSSFGIDQGNCNSGAYKPWNDSYNAMGNVGILSCGATANANWNIDAVGDVPTACNSQYLVSVTNTTSSDGKNGSAGYGKTTIDLGAPGTSVRSTYSNGGYTNLTGTSMASPQVAGAISFLHSVASDEFKTFRSSDHAGAAAEIKKIILENVDPLNALNNKTVSGGRLNLFKAAQAVNSWTNGGGSTLGTITPYGQGLGGVNIANLLSTSTPNIGGTIAFVVTGYTQSSSAWLMLAALQANIPAFGGTGLLDANTALYTVNFPVFGGIGSTIVPVINDPAFVGLNVYAQTVAADGTQVQGLALSNGLHIVLGQ